MYVRELLEVLVGLKNFSAEAIPIGTPTPVVSEDAGISREDPHDWRGIKSKPLLDPRIPGWVCSGVSSPRASP
jgi:hypothetical protein